MSADTTPVIASPAILNTVGRMVPTAPTKVPSMPAWRYCWISAGMPEDSAALMPTTASGLACLTLARRRGSRSA